MIDSDFVREIIDNSEPKIIDVAGRTYSNHSFSEIKPNLSGCINVKDLQAIINYYIYHEHSFIVINNFTCVSVYDYKDGWQYKAMECSIESSPLKNAAMDMSRFLQYLQAEFKMSDNLRELMMLVSSVQQVQKISASDSGFSQEVIYQETVATKNKAKTKPSYLLTRFITFPEVIQPSGNYMVRISKKDDGVFFNIIEECSGQPENTAIRYIREYIMQQLPDDRKSKVY